MGNVNVTQSTQVIFATSVVTIIMMLVIVFVKVSSNSVFLMSE